MANGQGGARIGAGRKKKALADNIAAVSYTHLTLPTILLV